MMIDNVDNLVLEMLKLLRNEVKSLGVKMDEQFESVRLRLGSMENRHKKPQTPNLAIAR